MLDVEDVTVDVLLSWSQIYFQKKYQNFVGAWSPNDFVGVGNGHARLYCLRSPS